MRLSIVVPVFNEEECIGALIEEIARISPLLPLADIVIVDDGSTDETAQVVLGMKSTIPTLRLIQHAERRGQSTAIHTGIRSAGGSLITTMDGDGQNDPADIPALLAAYESAAGEVGRVMIAGQRKNRQDTAVRRISSKIANRVRRAILDDGVRDTGCSLKLFRREDFLALPFFKHLHRFIPALMKASGVHLVVVDVSHRPRTRGESKYGIWDRLWVGLYDLVGVSWLTRRMLPPVATEEK